MSVDKEDKEQNKIAAVDKKALLFGLMAVFLCGIGFGIIIPVVPFLVAPYTSSPDEQAILVTLLTAVYAVCVFLAAPGLGALSDRYGRRPLLLLCLTGSALGYLVFGLGGALWVLFAGRIIEGITGGSISTIFAYFADITPREQRSKYFGWISAVAGVGAAIGPALGGLLAGVGYAVPLYFGAVITLFNVGYGLCYMPESLDKTKRLKTISLVRLNPFSQLIAVLSLKNLKRLFAAGLLLWIPNGALQSIFSQLIIDTFQWPAAFIGLMFSIIGAQNMISQAVIVPRLLLKMNDTQLAIAGMAAEIIGYSLIAAAVLFTFYPLLMAGMFIFAFGDSIFEPSFNGMISQSDTSGEQGRIQGGSQSMQALARMIGPIIGGQIYVTLGHAAPAFMGMLLIAAAIPVLYRVRV